MKRLFLAALLLASCGKGGQPDIQISDPWARETVTGQTATAAYMTIANDGSGGDRLMSVNADAPAMAMLHSSETSGGISRMRSMEAGVAIPAGGRIEFRPGGSHVMISGLSAPLRSGQALKLTLQFEKTGVRAVNVPIVGAGETR